MDGLPHAGPAALVREAVAHPGPTLLVAAGIAAYVASLALWMFSLEGLPLGRAYSLLGLSYALVHLGAVALPWFDEPLRALRVLGVCLVVAGVVVIHRRRGYTGEPDRPSPRAIPR